MSNLNPSLLPSYLRPETLTTANLTWQGITPSAPKFDDVYFMPEQGLAESQYVFLQQNDLPARWQTASDKAFVMGETGFGTGLNFLVAASEFFATAHSSNRLHWLTTELYPLTAEDLRLAWQAWPQLIQQPEIAELTEALLAQYPLNISGFHRLNLSPRVSLTLLLGDAATNLAGLASKQGKIDAWALDGFAPSKNPSMWSPELFAALASNSHQQTSFATFSAAGIVKRGLTQAGFNIERAKGFGHKRHLLKGIATESFSLPSVINKQEKIAVIGAGLAGLSTAYALQQKGFQVEVFEAADTVAAGASGNNQGALYVKLAVDANPNSRFYLAGLEFSRRWLNQLNLLAKQQEQEAIFYPSGLIQLAFNEQEAQRQAKFVQQQDLPACLVTYVNQAEASKIAGINLPTGGLHYPLTGWAQPKAICQLLASQLTVHLNSQLDELIPTTQGWQLKIAGQPAQEFNQVVLANSFAAKQLEVAAHLPLKVIQGQISQLAVEKTQQPPKCVITGASYLCPPSKQQAFTFGASFNLGQTSIQITQADNQHNLEALQQLVPDFLTQPVSPTEIAARASVRCTAPNYLPKVGQLAEGLWVSLAHGSKGLASIPLSAEILASEIAQEPAPLENDLLARLQP